MQKEVFQKTEECLTIIPEAVTFLRGQLFNQGSKKVNRLTKNANNISEYILQSEMAKEDKQEWILILQTLLTAQESKDYVLMADVLEGDMIVFLQKLQSALLQEGEIVVNEYWEENMKSLEKMNPSLYKKIFRDSEDTTKQSVNVQYEPFLAVNGQPTLKVHLGEKVFCMHSTVNPEWEAKQLTKIWLEKNATEYMIFGMGVGYHVKALLEGDIGTKVTVFEYRIEPLVMALTYLDWSEYILSGRLQIVYETDLLKVLQSMKTEREGSVLFMHYPSLQCVEEPELKEILEDYFIKISSMLEQGKLLDRNFAYLQKQNFPVCDELREMFSHKKVVIVAGGPSLDDEMDSLKKYRDDLVILSVGTSARKLIAAGICPDAIIITDPLDTMYRQVEGVQTENIPLLLLSTASRTVVDCYKGQIYVVYQKGYEAAEEVASEHSYTLFQTGGSVTTTALDVCIRFGAEKIILVGADMAYTDNRSHAGGLGYEENDFSNFRQVTAVGGGIVNTTKNLDTYRKWIERRIEGLKSPVVYNTSRGARIAGTIEAKLEDIYV